MPAAAAPGVVCIGSSAGGLASLRAIVRALPRAFPWAVLITQHFPLDVASHLPQILLRDSALPVREAAEGDPVVGGLMLTSPSAAVMGIAADMTVAFRPRHRGHPDSIDHLFATAAAAAAPAVVAAVLSGMGWDGAAGAVVVKETGGTVLVESPETAEWDSMPRATLRTGTVDASLPSGELAAALVRLAHPR